MPAGIGIKKLFQIDLFLRKYGRFYSEDRISCYKLPFEKIAGILYKYLSTAALT